MRRGVTAVVVAAVVLAAAVGAWLYLGGGGDHTPRCLVAASSAGFGTSAEDAATYRLTPEQAGNAATIAAVGDKLGMPDHAVTVAIATALQESGLRNLAAGDRDSAGLFQQRPSQGWGSRSQIRDPVYASTAFYGRLKEQPGWQQLSVTEAAQRVQRSAAPGAYATWEPEARAVAAALTGEWAAALTCRNLAVTAARADLVTTATRELGTAVLSGRHEPAQGWAMASWLVANATRFGVDTVTFDGRTWTADSGHWSQASAADGVLSLHQVAEAPN